MSAPMIGHRGREFQDLYAEIQPGLQELFDTSQPVYLSTSSAWGVMEATVRNLVSNAVLNCCCGAFSDKWYDVSQRCGKMAEALRSQWGQPIDPGELDARLSSGQFDTVTVVHNETSTGVVNPLDDIAAVVKRHPGVLLVVDAVSSFSAVPTPRDAWDAAVILTGSQKALALPPGLALFTVSLAALERAASIPDRGYYFDFLEFDANHAKNMTPSTPCISLIRGLRHKLEEIRAEGLENRYARHARLNGLVHDWVERQGFEHFAPEGFRSPTLTCVSNNRGIDVARLLDLLRREHGFAIDGGYGKLKGRTFRISNMGDETETSLGELLQALDYCLTQL
ncbi:MAG TPA: alanine--glyoxylate aminotransferase family protein [Verrucomicrobiales bacterium]|nr:alanine--glyoxylate aminotransferase family protein [Verrucomicrobiales bacterium]